MSVIFVLQIREVLAYTFKTADKYVKAKAGVLGSTLPRKKPSSSNSK